MNNIFLLLGSNEGDRSAYIEFGIKSLAIRKCKIIQKSSVYETAAWGKKNQDSFLNQVIEITSSVDAQSLLRLCKQIEKRAGRIENEKWGPRVLDIDILYYNNHVVQTENLQIPHPGIPNRAFTLVPLVEIAPDFVHPILALTSSQMLTACTDTLPVVQFSSK